jgi:signal transduction histidine kinase
LSVLRDQAGALLHALRHPKTTVRWRLTLMYGGLFLVSGAVLLATTYTLVSHATVTDSRITGVHFDRAGAVALRAPSSVRGPIWTGASRQIVVPRRVRELLLSRTGQQAAAFVGSDQRIQDLHELVIESIIALAIMAVLSMALGWLVAGRVLAPLRTMTETAQQISAASLDQRLALDGPPDELRKLGDTIDGLLERLEAAFEAQRRFVANASHELRTPLTAVRALLEMVLSDPGATVANFRDVCEQVLDEGEQQEQLIDALLALAQSQRGIDRPELVDLAVITSSAVDAHELGAITRGAQLDVSLSPALLSGDRRLIERLVSNLLENALRHNVPGGRVQIRVIPHGERATLTITNTGPVVPADQVQRLLAPFQRLVPDRVSDRDGLGLGLSIVSAIANAHDATLSVEPRDGGGLQIAVRFPRLPDGVLHPSPLTELPTPVALAS